MSEGDWVSEGTDSVGLRPRWAWLLFLALFAAVAGMVFAADIELQRRPSLPWMLALFSACAGLVIIVAGVRVRNDWLSHRYLRRALLIVLAAAVLAAGFNYFYLGRGLIRTTHPHVWDIYHYMLGPKYYAELDYPDLYDCTLAALPKRYRTGRIRDLRTNGWISAREALERTNCFDAFSESRWNEFKSDLGVLAEARSWKYVRSILEDKGYNGTPTHSVIAGVLANSVDLDREMLSMITLVDVFAICLLMAVIVSAFGWEIGLLFALYYFCNAADRHLIIGNSFFRYIWLVMLGLGIVGLRRQRYGLAGACFATSAMLNLFPLVFLVGIGLKMVVAGVRERSLSPNYRHFLIGAVAASVLLFAVGASTARGIGNYMSFVENIQVHDVGGRLPGFGVGLKFMFIDSGDKDADQPRISQSIKQENFQKVAAYYFVAAALFVGLAFWVATRLDDVQATVLVGFTLLFCLLGTTAYYFACGSFLVLLWHDRYREPTAAVMLGLLFIFNSLALFGWWAEFHRFFVFNRLVSGTWTVYLAIVLAYLAASTVVRRLENRQHG